MDRREFVLAAASVPFALRYSQEALSGARPLALVTADLESRIAVVDLSSGRVLRSIRTLPGPRSIEAVDAARAVVAHTAGGAVTIVDGPSLRVRHVLRDFREPRYTAAHPDGRHAFVTDSETGYVVAVDVVRGRALGHVGLAGPARHISLDPTGRTLWVSLGSKAERLAVVDVRRPAHPRLRRYVRPPFLAHDVGFAPGGRHVWVTSGDRGALAVYDARSGRALRRLPGDAPPQHVTFLGEHAYVSSGDDGTVRLQSLRDGRVLATTRVPAGSYNVQQGFGFVLTPSLERGTLCILAPRGRLLHEVRVARSSHDACLVASA